MKNIRTLSSTLELAPFVPAWDELARDAAEKNVFYESWMLLPAMNLLKGGSIQVVLIHDPALSKLLGVFPLVLGNSFLGIPGASVSLWKHLHCFLATPLIRRGSERLCIEQFFSWLDAGPLKHLAFKFEGLRGDGPVWDTLSEYVTDSGRSLDLLESHERALLETSKNADEYIRAALGGKGLKDIRRKTSTLAEVGPVSMTTLSSKSDLSKYLDAFLTLEQSGWKGSAGTAIGLRQNEKRYFERVVESAFDRGQLLMQILSAGESAAAVKLSFTSGDECFAAKIAYNEELHRSSPGMLLELENIRYLLNGSGIRVMDSCSAPTSTMLNRVLTERRRIVSGFISRRSLLSRLAVKGGARARSFKRKLKARNSEEKNSEDSTSETTASSLADRRE